MNLKRTPKEGKKRRTLQSATVTMTRLLTVRSKEAEKAASRELLSEDWHVKKMEIRELIGDTKRRMHYKKL